LTRCSIRSVSRPEVSIVVPLYNEADTLPELHRRLSAALAREGCTYELVFVDDGSQDATARLMASLHAQDSHLTAVYLSRNFGHQAAFSAGLVQARGRAVVLMDGDLQDPPEVLGRLLARWREGYEVVYAVRARRKEGLVKRACYAVFYRLWRAVSDLDIPLDAGDFCLMDRQVVLALRRMPERQRFLRGLRAFAGFRQVGVRYERAGRHAGRSKYSLRALLRLALDGLVGFGSCPLRVVSWLGLASAGLALALAVWQGAIALRTGTTPAGWAIASFVVLLVGAAQLLGLGIVGEYVQRIFVEVKGRPTYLIRQVRRSPLWRGRKESAAPRKRNSTAAA
jgi:dolichol-phosphate mannosyltransferase